MSFTIHQFSQNGLDISEIRNENNNSWIQILPSSGALWHGWIIKQGNVELNLINHYKDIADLQSNLSDSYKSAKLSPFACRIPHGKYSFQGKKYEFARKFKDGSAIHGLLFNQVFKQGKTVQNDDKVSVSFHYSYHKEDPGFPFDYDCTITYTLHVNNEVSLETKVKNTGTIMMPLVDGWHPYFTTGSKVDDCYLMFAADQIVEFDEKLIPTGKLLPYDAFLKERKIGNIELDNSFIADTKAVQPKCTFTDRVKNIKLAIYPSDNYPIIQLYIPPDRKSIAIESLSGAPDAFNNGMGLILLKPEEEKVFSVRYKAIIQ
ncbi:MAG: aldose 1-epimerase [Chitinophagaceae bacterium]